MSNKKKLIILGVLSVLIILVLVLGITRAFMKPIEETSSITEVSLSSCAKIRLTGTNSINLSNSYPMSRNKGLQTTPYSFTVSSSCDTTVGFNLYIATLNTNTLDASEIHYIVTNKGSKDALAEGVLSNALEDSGSFSDSEKTELNTGLHGTFSKIYKIHNESIPLSGSKDYDLYLFIDENSTNTSQGKSFNAGVAIKSYDRTKIYHKECDDSTLACHVAKKYTETQGENNLYLHDSTLENGANDNSYRYAGSSDTTNNFVCFGYDSQDGSCPIDNLYRIIGVFDGEVKLIKYDYANSNLLGTDGGYSTNTYSKSDYSTYKGELTTINRYYWNNNSNNTWSESQLNTINLNAKYLNNIGESWTKKIATHTWKVGGFSESFLGNLLTVFANEISTPVTNITYNAKIGLIYVSDYGYAAAPSAWTTNLFNFGTDDYSLSSITSVNWMYMGLDEWTVSPNTYSSISAFYLDNTGFVYSADMNVAQQGHVIRPVLYLEANVTYKSGEGTKDRPIILGD